MKKLVCAGLAGAMLLGLSACTFTKNPPATEPTETETSETETSESVGIIDLREAGVYSVEGKTAEEIVAQARDFSVVSLDNIKNFSDRFDVLPISDSKQGFTFTTVAVDGTPTSSISFIGLRGAQENMDGSYTLKKDGVLQMTYVFLDYESAVAAYEQFYADLTKDTALVDPENTTDSREGTAWQATVTYHKKMVTGESELDHSGIYEEVIINEKDESEIRYYYIPTYQIKLVKNTEDTYSLYVELPLVVEDSVPSDIPGAIPEISSGSAAVETSAGIEINPEENKTVLPIET